MRRLSLFLVLTCGACFDPDESATSDAGSDTDPSTSDTMSPTTLDSVTDTTMDPSMTTMDPSTTTTDPTATDPTATDPTATDPTATDPTDPSDTMPPDPACETDEVCVESAPAGWDGPGLRVVGNGNLPPECSGVYPIGGAAGLVDVDIEPPECDCECQPMNDASCDPVQIVYHEGLTCESGQGANTIEDAGCEPFFIGQGIQSVIADFPSAAPGQTCGTPDVTQNVPPLSIIEPTSLCRPRSLGSSCSERSTCLPQTELNTYCITREGEEPCPADSAYDERTVIYANIDDQRECGECTCGDLLGQCTGTITAFEGSNCGGGGTTAFFEVGACQGFPNDGFSSATYDEAGGQFTCADAQVSPTGSVELTEPTTLCCADF